MKSLKMRWPGLNCEVLCDGIAENQAILDVLMENLPVKALQGHEMIGGRILRCRAVQLKKVPFDFEEGDLKMESLQQAPVGRISLLGSLGSTTELLVKYDDCVDDRDYIPIAQVRAECIPQLRKAAKLQWQSATREQKTIVTELTEVE